MVKKCKEKIDDVLLSFGLEKVDYFITPFHLLFLFSLSFSLIFYLLFLRNCDKVVGKQWMVDIGGISISTLAMLAMNGDGVANHIWWVMAARVSQFPGMKLNSEKLFFEKGSQSPGPLLPDNFSLMTLWEFCNSAHYHNIHLIIYSIEKLEHNLQVTCSAAIIENLYIIEDF